MSSVETIGSPGGLGDEAIEVGLGGDELVEERGHLDAGERLADRRGFTELCEARARRDERALARDEDALRAADEERDVREDAAQRAHDGGELAAADVVELHPLLEDAALGEARSYELVELAAVEARRRRRTRRS